MATSENPQGYMPNVPLSLMPAAGRMSKTEVYEGYNFAQQRNSVIINTTSGTVRKWIGKMVAMDSKMRAAIASFFNAKKGGFGCFYAFESAPRRIYDESLGTASAASRLIIPCRESTVSDIRVAGVSGAFSVRRLLPRSGTYASIRFDGAAGNVSCGTNATLRQTGDFSAFAWVYQIANPTLANTICGNQSFNASGFTFEIDNVTNKLRLRTNQASANTTALSTGTVPVESWSHVGFSRSGTTITFYINGVSAGVVTSISNPVTATVAFKLGADSGGDFYSGMMNDVRYYASAVSAGEVANIIAGNATPTSNLKGWWLLTDGVNSFTTTVADSSGFANTGTLNSANLWVGGEDEIYWASPQTGAVTGTLFGRERIQCVFVGDMLPETFMVNSSEVTAFQDVVVQEVP